MTFSSAGRHERHARMRTVVGYDFGDLKIQVEGVSPADGKMAAAEHIFEEMSAHPWAARTTI
jgi:hypothetical protein